MNAIILGIKARVQFFADKSKVFALGAVVINAGARPFHSEKSGWDSISSTRINARIRSEGLTFLQDVFRYRALLLRVMGC